MEKKVNYEEVIDDEYQFPIFSEDPTEQNRLNVTFYSVRFPQKLGLDAGIGSWDLKIRIPRRKLRIYSQV